jgi:hypothetical protein
MTNWIMECVSSASLVVLVNGEATNFFRSGRGLRQGCPLSPLLFILVMESLSLLLKSSQSEGSLTGIKVSRLTKILHLLFVDDVLLLTNASVQEWKEIVSLIQKFCMVSGLKVNPIKSTVHFSGLSESELVSFKQFIPYKFFDLAVGFKYLGYFLKAGLQRSEDWLWLLTKVEKKINHWSYRWLSLGGRYTLCKAVLESQPVYWLSLASVPLSILHKLRKLLYNFLWNGNADTNHFHLVRWETLARPKCFGGWGFRNIFTFSKALAATTLWRVLTKDGLWQKVIKEKYFHSKTVFNWLRSTSFHQFSASKIWNGLLKSVYLITNWLSWKPGTGHLWL